MSPMTMLMAGIAAAMVWVLSPSTKSSKSKTGLRYGSGGGISINIYQGHEATSMGTSRDGARRGQGQSGPNKPMVTTRSGSSTSYSIKSDDD